MGSQRIAKDKKEVALRCCSSALLSKYTYIVYQLPLLDSSSEPLSALMNIII